MSVTLDPAKAAFYGQFVKAALAMYAADSISLTPHAQKIPFGWELTAWINMSDFSLTSETPTFYGIVAQQILNPDNRHDLASRGWVVYLETSIEQQAERAGRTRHRPLLHGGDPKARLEELMRAREPLYREIADLHASTDRRRVRSVAEHIVQQDRASLRQTAASANS